jgi:hypothetical protein
MGGSHAPVGSVACTAAAGSWCPPNTVDPVGVPCPQGSYCLGTSNQPVACTSVQAGNYCPQGEPSPAGDQCPVGYSWSESKQRTAGEGKADSKGDLGCAAWKLMLCCLLFCRFRCSWCACSPCVVFLPALLFSLTFLFSVLLSALAALLTSSLARARPPDSTGQLAEEMHAGSRGAEWH